MSKTLGVFGFAMASPQVLQPGDLDVPAPPRLWLTIKKWSSHDGTSVELTQDLCSVQEIESMVELLKSDLDEVCERAKVALVRAVK